MLSAVLYLLQRGTIRFYMWYERHMPILCFSIFVWMKSVAAPMGEVLFCFPRYQCQDSWLNPEMNKQGKPGIN